MARTVPTPDEVLDLAHRIKDAKIRVQQLEEEWNELFTPRATRNHATRLDGATLADRVLKLLHHDPNTTYSAFEIAANLNANRNSVGPMLSRLVTESKIEKRGHATYGALRKTPELFIGQEESPDAA
jgi:hypothetical protein